MRKPKEQVDEEGNEAPFFDDFESNNDSDDSDDDSGTSESRKPKKPARQRVELRNEAAVAAPAAVRLGRLRARRLRHEAVVYRPYATAWRVSTLAVRIRRCRERQAQAQRSCRAAGCAGARLRRRAAARRRHLRARVPARLYRHYGDDVSLDERHRRHRTCSTRAARSTCSSRITRCKRGYDATILTYNLELFDPTWFDAAERRDSRAPRRASRGQAVAALAGRDARLRRIPAVGRQARAARPRAVLAAQVRATRARDHGPECDVSLPRGARHAGDQCRRRRSRRACRPFRRAHGLSAQTRARS